MGKTRGRTIAIIIVALAAAFAAQTALRDSADAVLLGGAATLVIMIAACLLAAFAGNTDKAVLRLARAAAADEPVSESEAKAAGPVGEAIYAIWEARQEKSHWYEGILNTIPYGISVTDMDMKWTFCNKAALESMNKTMDQCIGHPCVEKGGKNCGTRIAALNSCGAGLMNCSASCPAATLWL